MSNHRLHLTPVNNLVAVGMREVSGIKFPELLALYYKVAGRHEHTIKVCLHTR